MNNVFFVGNKRAGTSLAVRLLNMHPDIFVTHESDLMWILFQARHGPPLPEKFEPYKMDSPSGMTATLERQEDYIRSQIKTNYAISMVSDSDWVSRTFNDVTLRLMIHGSHIQIPYSQKKTNLEWIGDKKPVQQSDPEIQAFTLDHFPNAKYIHMIRHPYAVMMSRAAYAARNEPIDIPPLWNTHGTAMLMDWARHEQRVLDMKFGGGIAPVFDILTVRLEDLAVDPTREIKSMFGFLGLKPPSFLSREALSHLVDPNPNGKFMSVPTFPGIKEVSEIMAHYGYGINED